MTEIREIAARELAPFDMFDEGRMARDIHFRYGAERVNLLGDVIVDPVIVEAGVCRAVLDENGMVRAEWEQMTEVKFAGDERVRVVRGMLPANADAALAESRRLHPEWPWTWPGE